MIKNITTVWVERVTWEKLAIELANPKPPFKPIQAGPQIDVWDEGLHGFGLRVGSSGRKTWMVMYRNAEGKKRRVAIGVYDAMNLAAARAKAKLEIGNAANNDGPAERAAREAAEMAALAATEAQEAAETFEAVARAVSEGIRG
jgi:hypothetical protein